MGIGDDSTAAQRLRLLQAEFLQPERRPVPGARPAAPSTPSAPLNLGMVDYIGAAVTEAVAHIRANVPETSPEALPLPEDATLIYTWMREQTAHLDEARQTAREQVIYRQSLEHAIQLGDHKIVRKHPCPECGCWGLFWQAARQAAVCFNHLCTDEHGQASAWPLKRLAHEHVISQKMLSKHATP